MAEDEPTEEPQWLLALRLVYLAARKAPLPADEFDHVKEAVNIVEAHIRTLEKPAEDADA